MAAPLLIPLIGAGLSAAGGLVNSILGRNTSIRNTEKTIQANKEMAKYAYSKDLEMWNLQNQYNSPEMQMERFKSAGLNPNLIYGQGNPGNATVIPKYQAPRQDYNYEPVQIPDMISKYQDLAMKSAQLDLLKEQKKIYSSEASIKATEALWRNSLLHNKNLFTGSQADLAWLKREWSYQGKDVESTQKGPSLWDTQAEGQKEINKLRWRESMLKQIETEWRKKGMTGTDPIQYRMLYKIFESLFD